MRRVVCVYEQFEDACVFDSYSSDESDEPRCVTANRPFFVTFVFELLFTLT